MDNESTNDGIYVRLLLQKPITRVLCVHHALCYTVQVLVYYRNQRMLGSSPNKSSVTILNCVRFHRTVVTCLCNLTTAPTVNRGESTGS